ncbi:Uncharacterized protein Fot_05415 [Forsythia ovata]|uniref:Uncharacterized protein n=1 Tax=Forsythia ovata TaxID=205694 RepID=A0ABD1WQE1_9LAMI
MASLDSLAAGDVYVCVDIGETERRKKYYSRDYEGKREGLVCLPSQTIDEESQYQQTTNRVRRSKKNSKAAFQDQPLPPSEFHFMPTSGIGQSNAAVFNNNGLAVDVHSMRANMARNRRRLEK